MNKNLQIVLGLAVALVVATAGYLVAVGLSRAPAEPHEAQSMAEQVEQNTQSMRDTLEAQIAGHATGEEQARLDSAMGQALSRNCVEWTEFHDNHPGDDARAKRDAACAAYRDYVRTGRVPED